MENLNAFLNPIPIEETREVVISKRFADKDGKPIPFKIRTISHEENKALNKKCRRYETVRGQRVEVFDNLKYTDSLIVACTVYPDFTDAELCKGYNTFDPLDVPGRMLRPGELNTLADAIMKLNDFESEGAEAIEDEAKN